MTTSKVPSSTQQNTKPEQVQTPPCIFGWKLFIQSLLRLWEYLKTEQSFQFILTSQINQDCVENLFSIICGFGGYRDNPDVEQLKSSFKYVVAAKLCVQSDASNCKVANDKILLDVSNTAMAKYVWSVPASVENPTDVGIAVIALPPLSNATQNVVVYMAGYLLFKVPVYDCDECSEQLILPRLPPLLKRCLFIPLFMKKYMKKEVLWSFQH